MRKTTVVIISVLGILLLVFGLSLGIYQVIKQNNIQKQEIEDNIVNGYQKFKNQVEDYNKVRELYFEEVKSNLYPESVEDEYTAWISIIDKYTKSVDKVEKASKTLKELCVNNFYSNKDVDNKCKSFVIAYETTINYYTKDIILFNETLADYRRENDESNNIKDYKLKYNYTDIDDNGEFIGKD